MFMSIGTKNVTKKIVLLQWKINPPFVALLREAAKKLFFSTFLEYHVPEFYLEKLGFGKE